ncbi:MAG: hypothetical protein QOK47_420, partial [Actinomycetota bacterium]|nr:hypothetical protein [Actinomycetota bacterium]
QRDLVRNERTNIETPESRMHAGMNGEVDRRGRALRQAGHRGYECIGLTGDREHASVVCRVGVDVKYLCPRLRYPSCERRHGVEIAAFGDVGDREHCHGAVTVVDVRKPPTNRLNI